MSKYIALVVSLFSIYLSVIASELWLISFSVLGYFLVIIAFIVDATTSPHIAVAQPECHPNALPTDPKSHHSTDMLVP
ncbi:hypothetical protein [Photobacterium sp. TY1-4]|uniref:hypothetical protein n=1 Tax=Photobacterium sp. TY1-4 TaxID=2899122 RepID=UPI0021C22065|nr:hypothetical protein [Photobacterium sp. TY1-4]UXI03819.1 hypothetical protein NH461_16990 [Photobacterium sp. TY1-4]